MKKTGIIIASLLICSISYAGYVTIEKKKIAIGDGTKVIGELPIQKRVEVVGETTNRYIIKYNSHLAGIDKKRLRFPKDEQPYIYPYVGMLEQIYEVTLELYKGEEYKVIKEDKTRYLIEYTFKDTPIEIWVEKNLVSYNTLSKQEIYEKQQIAKGLVKYQDRWVTPEEKFELEQKAKGLIKYEDKWLTYDQIQEAKGLVKYQDQWITPEEKFELEQKERGLIKYEDKWLTYDQVQEAKGLVKYQNKWITSEEKEQIELTQKRHEEEKKFEQEQEAKGLVKYEGKWMTTEERFELEQKAKGLIKHEGKWLTYDQMEGENYPGCDSVPDDEILPFERKVYNAAKQQLELHPELSDKEKFEVVAIEFNIHHLTAVDIYHKVNKIYHPELYRHNRQQAEEYETISGRDNGYKWHSVSYECKVSLCKDIAGRFGETDWRFYYDLLNSVYDTTDPNVLIQPIADMVAIGKKIRDN